MKKIGLVAKGNPVMDILHTKDGAILSGGGSSATVASIVSMLGISSGIIGRVGDDDYGLRLTEELEEYGLDMERLRISGLTSVNDILVEHNDRKIFRAYNTDAPPLDEEDYRYIAAACSFYCRAASGYFPEFMKFCEQNGIHALASLQKFSDSDAYDKNALYSPSVKIIFGNEDEMEEWVKDTHSIVVVTKAERGCTIYRNSKPQHFDAYPAEPVDPTGAGDTFAGAFIYGYLSGWSVERAARFANRLGALATTKYGARTALRALRQISNSINLQFDES